MSTVGIQLPGGREVAARVLDDGILSLRFTRPATDLDESAENRSASVVVSDGNCETYLKLSLECAHALRALLDVVFADRVELAG